MVAEDRTTEVGRGRGGDPRAPPAAGERRARRARRRPDRRRRGADRVRDAPAVPALRAWSLPVNRLGLP